MKNQNLKAESKLSRNLKLFVASFLALGAYACECSAQDRHRLFTAMCHVESNMDEEAVGDKGTAKGVAQIRPIMIKDVNCILGREAYTWPVKDYETSYEVFTVFVNHYGGKECSDERAARMWNGGPKGHKKKATQKYWKKVKAQL